MKKLLTGLLLTGAFLSAVPVCAQEAVQASQTPQDGEWRANFKRVGLELSSTEVKHAQEYANSPVTALNSDSQTVVKGVFDFVLEYDRSNMRWNNSVYAEYARTKLKPAEGPSDTNETADKILFSTDYAHKLWELYGAKVGPFVNLAYQTEFTANDNAPRTKIIRGMAGAKLFDGTVVKDLYLAGVGEYDMTYSDHVSKSAVEAGWLAEYELREGVKFATDGYFRRYLSYSRYIGTDLEYDLSAKARMDVAITKTLAVGPYVSYRYAKDRETSVAGSNFMIGLSLSYSDLFFLTKRVE